MPRTRLKPFRMLELFPNNGMQENVQSIQRSKRKFVPQRITEADLKEFSPAAKSRKVQSMSAKANSEKKRRFTAVRMVLTAADVEDTPPNATTKKKIKKSTTKTARKELFSTDKKKALRSNFRSTTFNKNAAPRKLAPSKKLDTTNPLIDINEAEAVLLKGASVGFKRPIQELSTQKTKLARASLPRLSLQPNQMKRKLAETETGSKFQSPIISLQLAEMPFENADNTVLNNPDISETDSEFLEMERKIGVEFAGAPALPSPQASSSQIKSQLKFDSPNKENRNLTGKIVDILQDVDGEFKRLKKHCESFERKFAESKREIGEILKSLQGNSGDFNCDKKADSLTPLMPRLENLRMSTLKKVTFSLNNSPRKSAMTNRSSLDDGSFNLSHDTTLNNTTAKDKGLERAIGLYNSMRKAYTSILSTPKFDRSALQTPTSVVRCKNSVSKKVQKQCMLLHDTPRK